MSLPYPLHREIAAFVFGGSVRVLDLRILFQRRSYESPLQDFEASAS